MAWRSLALAFSLGLATAAGVFAQNDAGQVAFANSGAPAAQAAFLHGLALLHDFEYPRAAASFRAAQKIDPSFAMAYWGEAMTFTHPVWFQQDLPAARAALQQLGSTPAERLAKAPTERERDYLRAIDVLYGEGSKEQRDIDYAAAMAALHARYPDDVDAAAFYAVALLGTAHHGRDFATYMRAAAVLEEVFPTHQQHPGVLHYLIHSYDDPIHAPLGLRAARLYGKVAPNAGHALHMTSHIFVAMGMWDEVIDANLHAIDVVNRQGAARSMPRMDCGHYSLWLHYAYLQERRFDEARKVMDACRASAFGQNFEPAGPMDSRQGRIQDYAIMRAHEVASGGTLSGQDAVVLPEGRNERARFTLAYGDLLAAAKGHDGTALAAAAGRLRTLAPEVLKAVGDATNPSDRLRVEIVLHQAEALQMAAAGKPEEALALLQKTAAREETMPLDFGPPLVEKPTLEFLGDQFMAMGRAAGGVQAYRSALERTPGRAPVLESLIRAQKAAGDEIAAAATSAQLAKYAGARK